MPIYTSKYANASDNKFMEEIREYLDKSPMLANMSDESFNNRFPDGTYKAFTEYEISRAEFANRVHTARGASIAISSALYCLEHDQKIIKVESKKLGCLFAPTDMRFSIIPVDLIRRIESQVVLSPAQLNEAEMLMNLAGLTLGVPIPKLPEPGDPELYEAMIELAREIILAKPRAYRPKFLDMLRLKGHPAKINEAEFKAMVTKMLQP